MSWISLAATRYNLRDILQHNLKDKDYQESRFTVVDAADGRDALLIGNGKYVKSEIERAEVLIEEYEEGKKTPHPAVMPQVLSLAVIASLGDKDYSKLFKLIADAKKYRNPWEKSLQHLAKRITGTAKIPDKPYSKPGHISNEVEWFRLVEKAPTAHLFNLAVCPDHSGWFLLCSYVLPLAFLLSQERKKSDWKKDLRELLKWGGPYPENGGTIVYERASETVSGTGNKGSSNQETGRGLDAVEIKNDELFVYYYLGCDWRGSLLFTDETNSYDFLDHVSSDWELVKNTVSDSQWSQISQRKSDSTYVIVYNAYQASVPEDDLNKAAKHYGLKLVAKDITEI